MAQLISVKLTRFDSSPWGFRLQGGKDFGQPLIIQKVNGNSIAEKAGLQAGDALIRVNNVEVFNLAHKEAQNAVVHAGNSFELTVQRGGGTWRPSVTPVGSTPTISQTSSVTPVTKTSLAHKPAAPSNIGSGYNIAAKPFVNGDTARNLTSKVYNSPIGIYSEETIAETLSAQTEVLAGGVLGVNFKKNEKTYNAANSEVLKMVQEIDNEPKEPEPEYVAAIQPPQSAPTTPKVSPIGNPLSGLRHVQAPEPRPEPVSQDPLKVLPPGQNICADCERLIVGLFVRIKDKSLHVECFKCATCGTSLKNVGYYNINSKLYCDVHAKLVARQNPPAADLEPVTFPPGAKPPSSIIGSALSSAAAPFTATTPGSPQPGTLAPLPFHAQQPGIRHVNAPRNAPFLNQTPPAAAPIQAPKLSFGPSSAAPAPSLSLPQKAPPPGILGGKAGPFGRDGFETMQGGSIQYHSYSTLYQSSYGEQSLTNFAPSGAKKMSICSEEIDNLQMNAKCMVKQLSEILEEQERCPSPVPMSKEEKLIDWESKKEWASYQRDQPIVQRNIVMLRESGEAFLRSHSTPVYELEALYEQQQMEIEIECEKIRALGIKKRNSIDVGVIRDIDLQILKSQKEIIQRQEKQKELEKKKHVRFQEEAEKKRRESVEIENNCKTERNASLPVQTVNPRCEDVERPSYVERQRDRSRTPVAELEAHERHEKMSRKTEAIYQTYDHLISDNQEEPIQENGDRPLTPIRAASPFPGSITYAEKNLLLKNIQGIDPKGQKKIKEETERYSSFPESQNERSRTPVAELEANERYDGMSKKTEAIYHTYEHIVAEDEEQSEQQEKARPLTPIRATSPFPGSIPHAEKNLLLKNIQGIQFEFDLNKPEQKKFKLPDLRNLEKFKPFTPKLERIESVDALVESKTAKQSAILSEKNERNNIERTSESAVVNHKEDTKRRSSSLISDIDKTISKECLEGSLPAQKPCSLVEAQRRQVCEELTHNEKFKRKQERFECSKTPVLELEEVACKQDLFERTQQVNSSYNEVSYGTERPRSRIGQPQAELQSISEAEKTMFFQNINGINYEFEHISELRQCVSEKEKSAFIKDIERTTSETATKEITFGKSGYEEFKREQERLLKLQKENELGTYEKLPEIRTALTVAAQPKLSLESSSDFKVDVSNRRSSGGGFPGVNVQRTPYQMHRAQQIQTTFEESLRSQETALTQFLGPSADEAKLAFAPKPCSEKRLELLASQAQFGPSIKPKVDPIPPLRPIPKPITLSEALTIAPERPFSPLLVATKASGDAKPAVDKPVTRVEKPTPLVEIKPIFEIKDLQLKKEGPIECVQEKKAQTCVIQGENVTGMIKQEVEQSEQNLNFESKAAEENLSIRQSEKNLIESFALAEESVSNDETKTVVVDKISALNEQQNVIKSSQYFEASQSSQSCSGISSVTQTTKQEGNVTRTITRKVQETTESSRKNVEIIQIDPVSGLRRTVDPAIYADESIYQTQNFSGLKKPQSIPTYQNQIVVETPSSMTPARVVTGSLATSTRPRSAIGKPATEKVPVTYRSRTPSALPHVNKNVPTYNQTEVYRSASPRPIPVPKLMNSQTVSQPQRATIQPGHKVYRSTSPTPLPFVTRSSESYRQPNKQSMSTLYPVEQTAYRSSSPLPVPKMVSSNAFYQPKKKSSEIQVEKVFRSKSPVPVPRLTGWNAQSDGKRITWPPKEEVPLKMEPQLSQNVKAKVAEREKLVQKQNELSKSYTDIIVPKTSLLQSHKPRTPAPKSDIVAPRPFGTPTPQRKIATPQFQPIKPVAITQAQLALVPAPKLTFSSGSHTGSAPTSTVKLTSSPESAFKPPDQPVRPVATRPTAAPVNGVGVVPFDTLPTLASQPNGADHSTAAGGVTGGAARGGAFAGSSAPRRGRGILNQPTGLRVPLCAQCNKTIRGPFITALGKTWCPEHFVCSTSQCRRQLADIGFVEEQGQLYCEFCFEKYIAPSCDKCNTKIKGDCLNAIGKHFHPECFNCAYCGKLFGNSAFFLEDGLPYCEADWNELFTTKCFACGFPIEAGDKWVEALNNNYHSQCFNCTVCKKNLEGQSFFAKGNRPFCKAHSR